MGTVGLSYFSTNKIMHFQALFVTIIFHMKALKLELTFKSGMQIRHISQNTISYVTT